MVLLALFQKRVVPSCSDSVFHFMRGKKFVLIVWNAFFASEFLQLRFLKFVASSYWRVMKNDNCECEVIGCGLYHSYNFWELSKTTKSLNQRFLRTEYQTCDLQNTTVGWGLWLEINASRIWWLLITSALSSSKKRTCLTHRITRDCQPRPLVIQVLYSLGFHFHLLKNYEVCLMTSLGK